MLWHKNGVGAIYGRTFYNHIKYNKYKNMKNVTSSLAIHLHKYFLWITNLAFKLGFLLCREKIDVSVFCITKLSDSSELFISTISY